MPGVGVISIDQLEELVNKFPNLKNGCMLIKIREGERHPLLTSKVSWDGVTDIMGKFGTSSADAMILNLLLSSRIQLVASGDGDIKHLGEFLHSQGKTVLEI
jgi:hypothetical protein